MTNKDFIVSQLAHYNFPVTTSITNILVTKPVSLINVELIYDYSYLVSIVTNN